MFTLETSVGGSSIKALVLLQVWVTGLSAGDAVIASTRMLVICALCSGTPTSLDRQLVALLQVLDIHLNVMLYVANSSDQRLTLLLAFFPF